MSPSRLANSFCLLVILVAFLAGLVVSLGGGVILLGQVSRRLRRWDTPWGRVLRVPVGIGAFAAVLALIVGLMCLLAVALDRGLARYM